MVAIVNRFRHYTDSENTREIGNLLTQLYNTEKLLIFDTEIRKILVQK